jgi:hypothetical protein
VRLLTARSLSVVAAKGTDVFACRLRPGRISPERFQSAPQEVNRPALDVGGEQLVLLGLGRDPVALCLSV